jgi:uncharacterized protein YjbI with pentapeptide repeats
MTGRKDEPSPTLSPRLPVRPEASVMEPGVDHDDEKHTDAVFDSLALAGRTARHWDIRRAIFNKVDLQKSRVSKLEFTDVRLSQCNLANASWQDSSVFRAEFRSCRMTGINLSNASIRHTLFEGCDLKLSTFRFASFKDVCFRQCMLQDSDFQEGNLSGVVFRDCDLTRAQMTRAILLGADIRGSRIEGIGGRPEDFKGLVIDESQFGVLSWQFVKQFGIDVRKAYEAD